MPLASPPPPSGTTTSFTSGACRAISSPIVPWPATTSGWSNAWTSVKPCASASRARRRLGLVVAAVHELHLAAVLAHRRHLGQRRLRGHDEHRAARPASRAAKATAWAWLPALAATTPHSSCSREQAANHVAWRRAT